MVDRGQKLNTLSKSLITTSLNNTFITIVTRNMSKKFTMHNVHPNFNVLTNIASAFGNDYTGLESASNWLKYIICCNAFQMHFSMHFPCIFDLSLIPGFRK